MQGSRHLKFFHHTKFKFLLVGPVFWCNLSPLKSPSGLCNSKYSKHNVHFWGGIKPYFYTMLVLKYSKLLWGRWNRTLHIFGFPVALCKLRSAKLGDDSFIRFWRHTLCPLHFWVLLCGCEHPCALFRLCTIRKRNVQSTLPCTIVMFWLTS